MLLHPVKPLAVLCLATGIASGQQCNTDGSQYSYSETVSAGTRTITESGSLPVAQMDEHQPELPSRTDIDLEDPVRTNV